MRLLLGLVLAVSVAVPLASRQPASPFMRVVGYYADWTAARYPLAGIPADKLTHVNYAFGKIDATNRLTWNEAAATGQVYPGDCDGPSCAHGLFNQITVVKRAHPALRFLMSVGGWTDSGLFYELAATEEGRQTFAASCAAFLQKYPQFDGIDIDWEHPVAGGVQPGQPRDARNYVLLLTALRRALGASKLLTVAVGAGPRAIDPLEYADMAAQLDWINVMTYDFHAGGMRAGFNAPLYDHDDPNPRLNLHAAVEAIVAKGVPRSQVVAGVPFYGRGWSGVESAAPWNTGTGTLQVGAYTRIAETFLTGPGYVRHWDDVAKVPWLYNEAAKEWITYEDPESMTLKGRYVVEHQLGGAMFWELSNDDGRLLDALRRGLGLPAGARPD